MHDILYERQTTWENDSKPKDLFVQYAEELKLDKNKFTTDLTSQDVLNRVEHGITSGNNALVNATPSFFLNGQRLPSFNNYDEFKNYLQQAANSTGTPQ
jgi:protein-disulfide isomerase